MADENIKRVSSFIDSASARCESALICSVRG